MRDCILNFAERIVDAIYDIPIYRTSSQPEPKIIAHRGAWDVDSIIENTMPAFERAQSLGLWGIEFDVHFTSDNVPVVNHDEDLIRCHGHSYKIREISSNDLKRFAPQVPLLKEVLELKGLHFMIEVKTKLDDVQVGILEDHFKNLTPCQDFHLLSLKPELIRVTDRLSSKLWILVGELYLSKFVDLSIQQNLGGVAGHYLGMNRKARALLHARGQNAGVGFVSTRNLFCREWQRGVDWVFTNTPGNLVVS